MNENDCRISDRDDLLDNFAAELARAAYCVVLRHRSSDTWLDLELDLWKALTDTVKHRGEEALRISAGDLPPDLVIGQPEAVPGDGQDGRGQWGVAR
jgi:hypothetical protein